MAVVLLPSFPILRTLDGALFPSVTITFEVFCLFFKVALSSAYIPHTTKVESQTVRSELHHNLGLAPTVSFLLLFLFL